MKNRSAKKGSASRSSRPKSASPSSSSSVKRSSRSTALPFPNEWSEFIGLLSSHRVRFLVVGAHALAVIGQVRATKDLDLLVEPTPANARRVCAALAEFGFRTLAEEAEAFATPDRMATLGREPLRIDLMTSISGVTFADAWRGRVVVSLAGHSVAVLGREEFLRNKRASARAKDLADIALVEELQGTTPPARESKRSRR